MGFFDKMVEEFGTKTGKAIGNKMYGSHADDYKIGHHNESQAKLELQKTASQAELEKQKMENQAELERQRAKLQKERMEYEKNQKLLDTVLNIEFDSADKDGIVKALTTLSSYVDLWSKDRQLKGHIDAAISKFDTGLAILSAVDANNPMNGHFLKKKIEWIEKKKKRKKRTLITIIVSIVVIFIVTFLIVSC